MMFPLQVKVTQQHIEMSSRPNLAQELHCPIEYAILSITNDINVNVLPDGNIILRTRFDQLRYSITLPQVADFVSAYDNHVTARIKPFEFYI